MSFSFDLLSSPTCPLCLVPKPTSDAVPGQEVWISFGHSEEVSHCLPTYCTQVYSNRVYVPRIIDHLSSIIFRQEKSISRTNIVYNTATYRICWGHKLELDLGKCKQREYIRMISEGHSSNGGDGEIVLTMGRARQLQRVRKLKPQSQAYSRSLSLQWVPPLVSMRVPFLLPLCYSEDSNHPNHPPI